MEDQVDSVEPWKDRGRTVKGQDGVRRDRRPRHRDPCPDHPHPRSARSDLRRDMGGTAPQDPGDDHRPCRPPPPEDQQPEPDRDRNGPSDLLRDLLPDH